MLCSKPRTLARNGVARAEKVLAAKRAGIREIILCAQNEKDIDEIDSSFIKGLNFQYVKTMQQVLEIALQ